MLLWVMIQVVDKILAVVVFIYSWDYVATNPIYGRLDDDTLLERLLVKLFSRTKSILPESMPLRPQLYQKLHDFSTAVITNALKPEPCPDSISTDPKSQPHRLAIRCTSSPQPSPPAPVEPVARPRLEKHTPDTKRGPTVVTRYNFQTVTPKFDVQNNISHFLATHGRPKSFLREPQVVKKHDQDETRKCHTDDGTPAKQDHQTEVCLNTSKDQLEPQVLKKHNKDETRKCHTDDGTPAKQDHRTEVRLNTSKDQLEPQVLKKHDRDSTRICHTDDGTPAEQARQTIVCPNTSKDQLELQVLKKHDRDSTRICHTENGPPAEQARQTMVCPNTLKDQLERAASSSSEARILIHELRGCLAQQVPRKQKTAPARADFVNALAKLEAEVNQEEVYFMNARYGLGGKTLVHKLALDLERDEFTRHLQGYRATVDMLIDTLEKAHGLVVLRPTDWQRIYACGQQLWQIREAGKRDLWCELPKPAPRHTDPGTRLNGCIGVENRHGTTTATGGDANPRAKAKAKGRRCVRWEFNMEDAGS